MKFSGELTVKAPRAQVYAKVRDARFFASCVDGVQDLQETAPDTYSAVFATKVAYMNFKFNVTVQVVRAEEPSEIEAKVEGTPLGIVGRLTATSLTRLTEDGERDENQLRGRCRAHRKARQPRPAGAALQGQGDGTAIRRAPRRGFCGAGLMSSAHSRESGNSAPGPRFRGDERHSIFSE